jgi:hypothetical protein
MADPGVPADQSARLDALRERQRSIRSKLRVLSPLAAYTAGQEAARDTQRERAAVEADTARLWAALSLVITGRVDQVREHLADLTDLDLVAALGEAGRALAEVCAEVTRGDRS